MTISTSVRRAAFLAAAVCGMAVAASGVYAQRGFGRYFREGSYPPRFPPDGHFNDGAFTVCKIMYTQVRREWMGIGWATDYPYAGRNLMVRASELTKIRISMDATSEPNFWVVRLTDDALFQCPFTMASDVGTMGISPEEAVRLREYLLKGGFLWVDDFWGTEAWDHWVSQISQVLSPIDYPIVDLPIEHPMFHTLHEVSKVPQVTNIQFWRGSGGSVTSERGDDSVDVHTRAIVDKTGRILVLMTHNTDLGDSWEREGEDPEYFYQFSPAGYALGLNVLLYALTH